MIIFLTTLYLGMENFDPDRYPSKEIQLDWLKEYLTAFGELSGEMLLEPTKEKVEDLYVAVNKCAAVSLK